MELPRNAQRKQVYKHAFPVHPMPQPLLLTLTQGVRTELVLDARNCEWKGCRKSFTHNRMLDLTKLINLKQNDEFHKEESQLPVDPEVPRCFPLRALRACPALTICVQAGFNTHYKSVICLLLLSNIACSMFMFICLGLKVMKQKEFKIVP